MDLISEYKKQQSWRNWETYLEHIPLKQSDTVLDLGCSVGAVSYVFSSQATQVIGVDLEPDFIEFCVANKRENEEFICSNYLDLDFSKLSSVTGVWSSFSLSYLAEPKAFLSNLFSIMPKGSWIALLDISCFISGNMDKKSHFYDMVRSFELESHRSGVYDFDFGTRQKDLLAEVGFNIVHVDENVFDKELNFDGAAEGEVVDVWRARLDRMKRIKKLMGDEHEKFIQDFVSHITSEHHKKSNNLKYVVAVK